MNQTSLIWSIINIRLKEVQIIKDQMGDILKNNLKFINKLKGCKLYYVEYSSTTYLKKIDDLFAVFAGGEEMDGQIKLSFFIPKQVNNKEDIIYPTLGNTGKALRKMYDEHKEFPSREKQTFCNAQMQIRLKSGTLYSFQNIANKETLCGKKSISVVECEDMYQGEIPIIKPSTKKKTTKRKVEAAELDKDDEPPKKKQKSLGQVLKKNESKKETMSKEADKSEKKKPKKKETLSDKSEKESKKSIQTNEDSEKQPDEKPQEQKTKHKLDEKVYHPKRPVIVSLVPQNQLLYESNKDENNVETPNENTQTGKDKSISSKTESENHSRNERKKSEKICLHVQTDEFAHPEMGLKNEKFIEKSNSGIPYSLSKMTSPKSPFHLGLKNQWESLADNDSKENVIKTLISLVFPPEKTNLSMNEMEKELNSIHTHFQLCFKNKEQHQFLLFPQTNDFCINVDMKQFESLDYTIFSLVQLCEDWAALNPQELQFSYEINSSAKMYHLTQWKKMYSLNQICIISNPCIISLHIFMNTILNNYPISGYDEWKEWFKKQSITIWKEKNIFKLLEQINTC